MDFTQALIQAKKEASQNNIDIERTDELLEDVQRQADCKFSKKNLTVFYLASTGYYSVDELGVMVNQTSANLKSDFNKNLCDIIKGYLNVPNGRLGIVSLRHCLHKNGFFMPQVKDIKKPMESQYYESLEIEDDEHFW